MSVDPQLMFHRPTHLLFEIFLDPAITDQKPRLSELRARLNHVCDRHSIPSHDLDRLGRGSILAFAILTEGQGLIEDDPIDDEDIPF